jgi:hypothetical protein
MQTFPWLMATYVPVTVLYLTATWAVIAVISRSLFGEHRWLFRLAITLAAVLTSGLGVLAGELYALFVEIVRVGDGHLGDRTAAIPYIRWELHSFIIGLVLFLAAVPVYRQLRGRAQSRTTEGWQRLIPHT